MGYYLKEPQRYSDARIGTDLFNQLSNAQQTMESRAKESGKTVNRLLQRQEEQTRADMLLKNRLAREDKLLDNRVAREDDKFNIANGVYTGDNEAYAKISANNATKEAERATLAKIQLNNANYTQKQHNDEDAYVRAMIATRGQKTYDNTALRNKVNEETFSDKDIMNDAMYAKLHNDSPAPKYGPDIKEFNERAQELGKLYESGKDATVQERVGSLPGMQDNIAYGKEMIKADVGKEAAAAVLKAKASEAKNKIIAKIAAGTSAKKRTGDNKIASPMDIDAILRGSGISQKSPVYSKLKTQLATKMRDATEEYSVADYARGINEGKDESWWKVWKPNDKAPSIKMGKSSITDGKSDATNVYLKSEAARLQKIIDGDTSKSTGVDVDKLLASIRGTDATPDEKKIVIPKQPPKDEEYTAYMTPNDEKRLKQGSPEDIAGYITETAADKKYADTNSLKQKYIQELVTKYYDPAVEDSKIVDNIQNKLLKTVTSRRATSKGITKAKLSAMLELKAMPRMRDKSSKELQAIVDKIVARGVQQKKANFLTK